MQINKKNPVDKPISLGQAMLLIIVTTTFVFVLLNLQTAMTVISWLFSILSPFLIGIVLAFLVNLLLVPLETRVFAPLMRFKVWQKIHRGVLVVLSLAIVLGIIALLGLLIVPQLHESIVTFSKTFPAAMQNMQTALNDWLTSHNVSLPSLQATSFDWQSMLSHAGNLVASVSPHVATLAGSITVGVLNLFMGFVFALYMLLSKERLLRNANAVLRAYCSATMRTRLLYVARLTNKTFKSFVIGQLTEALILAVLYLIFTSIFRMPYSLLIATVMAVCCLIPMFGAVIGSVISIFILLMVSPASALVFLIMAIVIQQIEGNFIYPFIVGDSIGLPAMWVLFSLVIGGSLFGAVGMILSVPIMSVIYTLLKRDVAEKNNALSSSSEENSAQPQSHDAPTA